MTTSLTLAGVCGWPIHHSLSPLIHTYWLRQMKIVGAYVHFAVRPDEAVYAFETLKHTSIAGVNVTMPLKHSAAEAADQLTPDAERLGVVNCLYKRKSQLVGHNTDLEGFAAPLLKKYGPQAVMNSAALVLGAGGAAKAVVGALLSLNCPEIRVCARRARQAEELVGTMNIPNLYAIDWDKRHMALTSSDLVINATSGGMKGKSELDIDLKDARPTSFIYDLIYNPQETGLIKQAKLQNLSHVGGLDMLIAQARPSFKLFYGQRPPDHLDPSPLLIEALSS